MSVICIEPRDKLEKTRSQRLGGVVQMVPAWDAFNVMTSAVTFLPTTHYYAHGLKLNDSVSIAYPESCPVLSSRLSSNARFLYSPLSPLPRLGSSGAQRLDGMLDTRARAEVRGYEEAAKIGPVIFSPSFVIAHKDQKVRRGVSNVLLTFGCESAAG
ncbi:hypothetical protein PC9H_005818 [Pleurotus ostreatus]|uniref:Uncharacterized protein n=1 Tax=Pleurotus ostreatus TaxID=5322 RepID=A0A8H7DUR1_PLEOS|nr:uncharacterized protein PC9H_005818 [Pleurotus ostreatus]KAF7433852.1 hypothetical protein PC9H_005818 [Pleurotus ostreatus]